MELLVEGSGLDALSAERGDDEAGIGAAGRHPLGLGDDPALMAPALERGPGEVGEAPCRLAAPTGVALGSCEVGTDMLDQARIPCEPEDIVDPVRLAPGHQPLAGEAGVCAQHDRHLRPALADARDNARHLVCRAGVGVDVRSPQLRRQQLVATEGVERQIAVAVVVAVEEAAFLMAVQRVVGGVQIEDQLFGRLCMTEAESGFSAGLREVAGDDGRAYVEPPFVQGLGDGSLPEATFRHYLIQDYLLLIQFARAYGLAAYKADALAEIRAASGGLKALVEVKMDLHRAHCVEWGIADDALEAVEADGTTLAYTAYVLERGLAGDLLDLRVALAPCVPGYGEIGAHLASHPATRTDGNPYATWIGMYAGDECQAFMRAEIEALGALAERRGGSARFVRLAETFRTATRLEAAFWQAGLDAAGASQTCSTRRRLTVTRR